MTETSFEIGCYQRNFIFGQRKTSARAHKRKLITQTRARARTHIRLRARTYGSNTLNPRRPPLKHTQHFTISSNEIQQKFHDEHVEIITTAAAAATSSDQFLLGCFFRNRRCVCQLLTEP